MTSWLLSSVLKIACRMHPCEILPGEIGLEFDGLVVVVAAAQRSKRRRRRKRSSCCWMISSLPHLTRSLLNYKPRSSNLVIMQIISTSLIRWIHHPFIIRDSSTSCRGFQWSPAASKPQGSCVVTGTGAHGPCSWSRSHHLLQLTAYESPQSRNEGLLLLELEDSRPYVEGQLQQMRDPA